MFLARQFGDIVNIYVTATAEEGRKWLVGKPRAVLAGQCSTRGSRANSEIVEQGQALHFRVGLLRRLQHRQFDIEAADRLGIVKILHR